MPDPKKQDPDLQPTTHPSEPYRKDRTKPVGRDSDATPGKDQEPTRTPNRTEPQEGAEPGPSDESLQEWSGQRKDPPTTGGADPDPFMIG